jgi:formylglycine-generating enzyme required for sulfatase activity
MSSLCPQPNCPQPINAADANFCRGCGSELILGDRYRCLRLLGRGGFGRTFLAQDEYQPTKARCVIKQFYPLDSSMQVRSIELFREESNRLAQLGGHLQIPSLYKQFSHQEYEYIAQEFIDGDNLAQELAAKGRNFQEKEIESLLIDILPVLTFIHQAEVIHRDIKPENIIRRRLDGKLCLVDFGAAKYATVTALAKTGTTIGSAEYVAPEQARGKAIFASDIYSLGVTCLHLLTNISPFDLFDPMEGEWIWRQYLDRHSVGEELGKILDRMVQNLLKDRYRTAAEVHTALTQTKSVPPLDRGKLGGFRSTTSIQNSSSQTKLDRTIKSTQLQKYPIVIDTCDSVQVQRNGTIATRHQHKIRYFRETLSRGGFWKKPHYLEMVVIPGGTFMMGAPLSENKHTKYEQPQHQVEIQPFFLGKYPVTQNQYQLLMGKNPSFFRGGEYPVENVDYQNAIAFCQVLAEKTGKPYRLPSEAEWEYATRAGSTTPFSCGATIMSDLGNFDGRENYNHAFESEFRNTTTAVGCFLGNAFGLYDLHGNVWEWCSDYWQDNYHHAPKNGEPWLDGNSTYHPLRGGSWSNPPRDCRSASRSPMSIFYTDRTIGFRVALSM